MNSVSIDTNLVLPFTLFNNSIKGRLVVLSDAASQAIERHTYPKSIKNLLLESLGLLTVIGGDSKNHNKMSLQAMGSGNVSLLLASLSSQNEIRCCARYKDPIPNEGILTDFLGEKGSMMLIMDNQETNYQAIVELKHASLTQSILHFFHQSEQIPTTIKLFTNCSEKGQRQVFALMLQQLPTKNVFERETLMDQWETILTFLETLTQEEAMNLEATTILYRLFHEFSLQIFSPKMIRFGCTCSREKLLQTLKSFGQDEIKNMYEDNKIYGDCEFCGSRYSFTEADFN